jgi:hypothetical protein
MTLGRGDVDGYGLPARSSLFHGGRQQKRTLRNKRRYLEHMARAIYDASFRGSL